jgi:hypothetical protein
MTKRVSAARPGPHNAHHRADHPHQSGHPRTVAILDGGDVETQLDQPFEEGSHDAIDPDLRHRLISETAYELYQRRGFADGYDLDDWLQAEEQVDHLLLHPATEAVPETRIGGRRSG